MAANTATRSPLELAALLDGISLFLYGLTETPQFAHKREALIALASAAGEARDEVEVRNELDGNEVEKRQEEFMGEVGLRGPGHYFVDPGFGRDVAMLDEQLRQLAENVIGVEWSHEHGCWRGADLGKLYG